jgi:hypothetical protein
MNKDVMPSIEILDALGKGGLMTSINNEKTTVIPLCPQYVVA